MRFFTVFQKVYIVEGCSRTSHLHQLRAFLNQTQHQHFSRVITFYLDDISPTQYNSFMYLYSKSHSFSGSIFLKWTSHIVLIFLCIISSL